MNHTKEVILEQIKIVVFVYFIIFVSQAISKETDYNKLAIGLFISFLIVIPAIIMKNLTAKFSLPGFAYATFLAALLTLPISPFKDLITGYVGNADFMVTVTPLLAFAGISIGDKLPQLKKLSWKIAIIALIVMCSTYFGSALISQLVLKANGII